MKTLRSLVLLTAVLVPAACRYAGAEAEVPCNCGLASQYTTNSSLKEALKETNAAQALDPKNSQALAQRARIEPASNEGLLNW